MRTRIVIAAAVLIAGVGASTVGVGPAGEDELALEAGPTAPGGEEPEDAEELVEVPQQPADDEEAAGREPAITESPKDIANSLDARGGATAGADLASVDSPSGVLVVGGRNGIAVMDLDTGQVSERLDESPARPGHQGLAVAGDLIVQAIGTDTRIHPLDLADPPTVLDVGGSRIVQAPDGTVWVGGHGVDTGSVPRQRWTPIDMQGPAAGDPVDVPSEAHILGAADEGLVVWLGERALVLDRAGAIHSTMADGVLLDAGPGGLLWHSCAHDADCRLEVTGVDGEPRAGSDRPALAHWPLDGGSQAHLTADGGRAVLWTHDDGDFRVGVVDLSSDTIWRLELEGLAGYPTASADGAWVAALADEPTAWAPKQAIVATTPSLDIGQPAAVALR